MLYSEIIAVCSQIHTKHIKTQSVPRSKHSVSVIKTSQSISTKRQSDGQAGEACEYPKQCSFGYGGTTQRNVLARRFGASAETLRFVFLTRSHISSQFSHIITISHFYDTPK
jgi:hypothetical protein